MTTTTLDGSGSPYAIAAGTVVVANDGDALVVLGSIDNAGTISLNGSGAYTGAPTTAEIAYMMLASPTVTLGGGGTLLLAGEFASQVFGSGATTQTLVNADTIAGAGVLGVGSPETLSSTITAEPILLVNAAAGVIDATGQHGTAEQLALFAGGATLRNAGLLEASAGGSLAITDATIDNTGGLILATGSGDVVSFATVSLSGGQITDSAGGGVAFVGGANTLAGLGGVATLAAGAALTLAVGASLSLRAATLDNAGTFVDAGALVLTQPTVTLNGGGTLGVTGSIGTGAPATLVNVDNTIVGGGALSGSDLSLTNDAAGVMIDTTLDLTGTVRNLGTMDNIVVGLGAGTTTIDNAGATLLANAGTVALFNADILGGTLAASNGGLFADGSEFLGAGNLTLDGGAAAVTIAAGATLQAWTIGQPSHVDVPQNLTFLGTVDLLGTVEALNTDPVGGGGAFANQGLLVAGPSGTIAGNLTNNGTVAVSAGTFGVSGAVAGAGRIDLAAGGTFDLGVGGTNTVDFGGHANAALVLNGPAANFTGTLANLADGDTIDLVGAQLASATVVGGATLAVGVAGGATLDYALANPEAGLTVALAGPLLSDVVVHCFAAGTRVHTAGGAVAVEDLRIGDIVLTAEGRRAPVRWLGHRRVDCARHPRPDGVWPVRVRAGAFGPGRPYRDLFLSPDHALFLDGVLIPVRHLIDGAAIARVARADVTYWHVELDRHDVLLAEGLECESFLDTGQRAAFGNGGAAVQSHPDFAARAWDADACAPLVVAGPALARGRLRTGHAARCLVAGHARP